MQKQVHIMLYKGVPDQAYVHEETAKRDIECFNRGKGKGPFYELKTVGLNDWEIVTRIKLGGTSTGRLNSTQPAPFHELTPRHRVRQPDVEVKGESMVGLDFSELEARILADTLATPSVASRKIMAVALGQVLGVKTLAAFMIGIEDGFTQGFELTTGVSYEDLVTQWEYDIGTKIGACLKVRG